MFVNFLQHRGSESFKVLNVFLRGSRKGKLHFTLNEQSRSMLDFLHEPIVRSMTYVSCCVLSVRGSEFLIQLSCLKSSSDYVIRMRTIPSAP